MDEGYKIRDQSKPHFLTFTVVDWIDVFTRKSYRDCLVESLDYCTHHKGMIVYAYVVMSNHIHLVAQAAHQNLSDLIRDFKKYTAKTILNQIQTEPAVRSLQLRTNNLNKNTVNRLRHLLMLISKLSLKVIKPPTCSSKPIP